MFRIELQPFDSGRLAPRVGVVHLDDPRAVEPGTAAAILAQGRAAGYDLLTLESSAPVELDGFEHRGVLRTFEAPLAAVADRAREVPGRRRVEVLTPGDWPAIRGLLRWAAPTRFSTDPRISRKTATEHKLAMIRVYVEQFPQLAVLARTRSGEVTGFLVSRMEPEATYFYEMVVAPDFRRSGVALDLVTVSALRLRDADCDGLVRSRIYADNLASIGFFERLGLRPASGEHHYYHAWP